MGAPHDSTTFGALQEALNRKALLEKDGEHYRSTLAEVCTERDDYRAQANRLQLQLESIRAQSDYWRAEAEQRSAQIRGMQSIVRRDTVIQQYLKAGDGSYVLCEHTADGLTTVHAPNGEALWEMLFKDADRLANEEFAARVAEELAA